MIVEGKRHHFVIADKFVFGCGHHGCSINRLIAPRNTNFFLDLLN